MVNRIIKDKQINHDNHIDESEARTHRSNNFPIKFLIFTAENMSVYCMDKFIMTSQLNLKATFFIDAKIE